MSQITQREREVWRGIADGLTLKEIGARLNISERTAESHKYTLSRKLGVDYGSGKSAKLTRLWLEQEAAPSEPKAK